MDLTLEVDMPPAGTQDNAISRADYGSDFREEVEASKYQAAQLEVLDHVKINNTIESPISTIKGVLNDSKGKEFNFNKEELRKAVERLKLVFIEFYRKLRLLKNYRYY